MSNDDGEFIETGETVEKRPTLAETMAMDNSSDDSETSSTSPERKEDKRKNAVAILRKLAE